MLTDFDQILPERTRPLRRAEYDKLVDLGVFEGEKIELLQGVLVEMSPQGFEHAEVLRRLTELLVTAFVGRATVQVQSPIAASDESEPEPDFAVIPRGNYSRAHPEVAHLVVEVSVSSLRKDSGLKASIYAAAGIPVYWIVNVPARRVVVHDTPVNGMYQRVVTVDEQAILTLAEFPDLALKVNDFLPSAE
jgi:Uma2 family endonuclease